VTLGTKKYYVIAGMTVAVNDGSGLQYLLTDHLGSVVAVTNASETLTSQQRYLPFGQMRTDLNGPRVTNTDFGFTGQRNLDGLGLMDYHARMYDVALGRFVQPDTITPEGPQGLNRFSYVNNNPINATDPTGHRNCQEDGYNCPGDHPSPSGSGGNGGGGGNGGNGNSSSFVTPQTSNYFGNSNGASTNYPAWYSGSYSGCFMCHAAVANGRTILTNSQLSMAYTNATNFQVMEGIFLLAAGSAGVAAGVSLTATTAGATTCEFSVGCIKTVDLSTTIRITHGDN
jgi:RHS repeat-associated protein